MLGKAEKFFLELVGIRYLELKANSMIFKHKFDFFIANIQQVNIKFIFL